MRIATYNPDLHRKGPGLLLRDILSGKDPQIIAVVETVAALRADVLVLTDFDFDHDLVALAALAAALAAEGSPYPYRFAIRPNTGMTTGLDLDGDGRLGGPADAQGFGFFAGQGGLAVLSRLPIDREAARDFSEFLWTELPGNLIGDSLSPEARAVQRLSSTAHWDVPLILPNGERLSLLIWHATPPVFDGPQDRNGRRNHDEAAFWLHLLDGALPMPAPKSPFILLGEAKLDAIDGDGRQAAINALIRHPKLQDIAPRGKSTHYDTGQKGDPAMDTALYDFGGLRVDYVLPSADLTVLDSGVLWPVENTPLAETTARASRHHPVWVDIALP
ncbi:endonuclease/exonuclease/phosphatase family protein [Pseudorhodobacter sp.]|uniref:endonuclease/exonuclease/phosphatase family protein n=1 Tax=Pseudorhodobacter sp. TaxID=1934400 RepID=UPI00264987CF|nr:endonuclease/exonuclease/phosphatase family protein [Pseudorhodobacter sp.]MDN5785494.1 endonuclease/exonuclease/phosphatase family protein [Pseudorhodobacter sp.]